MKVVTQYLVRNQDKVKEIFYSNSKDNEIPATKIFAFLQQTFEIQSLSIAKDGKEFFKDDNNEPYIEKIIQKFYKATPDGQNTKFYLYRINFDYSQVLSFLEYWLTTDNSITVRDPFQSEPSPSISISNEIQNSPDKERKAEQINLPPELRQSAVLDNQFIVEEEKKPMLIAAYQGQIKKMQEMLLNVPPGQQESVQIQEKIQLIKRKIALLSRNQNHIVEPGFSKEHSSLSPKKSKTEIKDKKFNFKALFEYYAKQNHLTGAKSSFQHIQHSTQTINYQKLVFFLKEYDLFPSKARDQKRIYNLYVRACSNTRDLFYSDFIAFLDKLPQIVINELQGSDQLKKEVMIAKIQSKSEKNKLLHNPFHSAEKQNFRIDKNDLKYEFKLKPINGKLEAEVNIELENRRRQKEQSKIQQQRQKRQKQIHKLKKIMAIDPYHPMVVKNGHLLKQKSYSVMQQPIVNLDNIQKIRDASFDMKAKFGISDFDEDPLKAMMSNRYDIDRRVEMLEREESLKMSNLMSGIIQRSQAKLAKLGLSPRKKNSKFAI